MSTRHLVLFNGGLKSTFLAELSKREGDTILCYFIQNYTERLLLKKIETLAVTLKVQFIAVDIDPAPIIHERFYICFI